MRNPAQLLPWFSMILMAMACPAMVRAESSAAISHPPLRHDLPMPVRPIVAGAIYVDATTGQDDQAGTAAAPLQTINQALQRVQPGQTIYLRQGVYYENVYLSQAGTAQSPITLCSYPGEKAILDGGIPAFFQQPAAMWESVADGVAGEYRSTRRFPNLHLPVASFGDSILGLQTYYHAIDLRATQDLVHYANYDKRREIDHAPLYCGPGLWYDQATGHLHARLAHTNVPGVVNYQGETDPRRVPLIIAPFRSVPLTIDGSSHVIVRDLVIRGGGYDTIKISLSDHITFDRVTVWAGTYGLRAFALRHFTMTDSAMYGSITPWVFRSDGGKRDYPNTPHRNLTRLNAHALVVAEAGREFSVYATPVNDHWTIEHCHFADAHDGLYLGGIHTRFAYNLVEDMQDDGVYLSQMYPRHFYLRQGATLDIHANIFRQVNMPFAFGGTEDTRDTVYVHRNLVDNRKLLNRLRPDEGQPLPDPWAGMLMSDHGSPPWPDVYTYHNTFICATDQREAHMRILTAVINKPQRHVFNNILIHLDRLPVFPLNLDPDKGPRYDANLFWSPSVKENVTADYFKAFRASPLFAKSKQVYEPGFTTHSIVAPPGFVRFSAEAGAVNDYRLAPDSPAINAGVALPESWPNPLRQHDAGQPDIGAFPADAPLWIVGPRPLE